MIKTAQQRIKIVCIVWVQYLVNESLALLSSAGIESITSLQPPRTRHDHIIILVGRTLVCQVCIRTQEA